jgi:hypothetical protein
VPSGSPLELDVGVLNAMQEAAPAGVSSAAVRPITSDPRVSGDDSNRIHEGI